MGSKEVADEYSSSLSDLTLNSKPLITMLTMLAEENLAHAAVIVKVIEKQVHSNANKLPLMYLIDSILKNVGKDYIKLFAQNIITTFTFVFEKTKCGCSQCQTVAQNSRGKANTKHRHKVDEKTRKKLYELRHTWNEVFPKSKLYMLDTKVQSVDPAWPVAAGPSGSPATSKPNIHINPNVIIKSGVVKGASLSSTTGEKDLKDLKDLEILKQEQQILELKKKKLIWEQKRQTRHQQKGEPEPVKPEPAKPVSKPTEDPSISADRRAEFLRSYKIKKKSQAQIEEDTKVSSTIHVNPRRVQQVLPKVAAATVPATSRDPRNEASRDPRIKPEKSRDPRIASETSRDPRIKTEASRDPRLGAADPVPSPVPSTGPSPVPSTGPSPVPSTGPSPVPSTGPSPVPSTGPSTVLSTVPSTVSSTVPPAKVNEPESTPSRDPRVSSKSTPLPESKAEVPKVKKESPSKRKKSQKSESRSSKSAPKDKENTPKSKPPEVPVPETSTPFKNKKSKRVYMKREESPEEKYTSQTSSGKRSRGYRNSNSDSEESDHYEGNVPNQSLYRPSSKKVKKPDITTPPPVISDTDYRHFTPPKRPSTTSENASPPKKDKIMEEDPVEPSPQGLGLFSNKDVDYRQILPQPITVPVIPTPSVPPPVPPTFSSKDQDDRKPSNNAREPLVCLNPPDNQDLTGAHTKGDMAPPDLLNTPARNAEARMRKPSFNSPHAASWEKFREKNPEFKEYTRQASISESEKLSLESEDAELHSLQQHGFPLRIRDINFPGELDRKRAAENRRRLYDEDEDEDEGSESPLRVESARENYKVILGQAEDQRRRGEINMTQYNQLLTTVVALMEQDKIQQVRDRDRQLMRTPQPQLSGPDDDPGSDHANDAPGPSTVPSIGPGRLPPTSGTGTTVVGPSGPPIGHSGGPPSGSLGVAANPDTGPSGGHPGAPHIGHTGGPPTGHPGPPLSRPPGGPPTGPHGAPLSGHRQGPGGSGSPGGPSRGLLNGDSSGRGGRGSFMRGDMSMGHRGSMIGRGGGDGRGGPGPENDDGWGRGGRGRGRRGRSGFNKESRSWGSRELLEDEWTGEPELPFLSDDYLHTVDRDNTTRVLVIDGVKREVRTYGQTAVALKGWDDPRILTFGEGQLNIVFDGGVFRLTMEIGEDYKEFTFEGKTHRVRLGPPSEELVLDGIGYHCLIGGGPITVQFDGASHTIALDGFDGKAPIVKYGPITNIEFLAGRIQLVIQATKLVPLFLDARPQRFSIDGRAFVIKFVDSLKAVTINNQKFPVKFGGLPISICVRGYRRFLSFSNLPDGIIPGKVVIRGMEGETPNVPRGGNHNLVETPVMQPPKQMSPKYDRSHQPPPVGAGPVSGGRGPMPPAPGPPLQRPGLHGPPQPPTLKGPPLQGPHNQGAVFTGPPPQGQAGPVPSPRPPVPQQPPQVQPPQVQPPQVPSVQQGPPPQHTSTSHEGSQTQTSALVSNPPVPIQGPPPHMPTPLIPGTIFSFINQPPPPIGNILPPVAPGSYTTTQLPPSVSKPSQVPTAVPPTVDSLFEKLIQIGLIGNKTRNKEEEKKEEEEEEEKEREADERIPVELMFSLDNLRKRRKWVIESVYRGMQCSSCGLRYPPEQTVQYSHHLDWHFRKNKKQQESTKKANTRKFYFSIEDWLQYEEIEDLEERVPSMFETEVGEESMDTGEVEAPSIAVSTDTSLEVCPTCHDKFPQFFHQETEEWRYRNAMEVDGLNYHPSCHQDNLRAEEAAKKAAEKEEAEREAAEKEAAEKEAAEREAAERETAETDVEKKDASIEEPDKEAIDKDKNKDENLKSVEKESTEVETDNENLEAEDTQDVPMESQASVTAKLDGMSLSSVRIKEEPMDVEDVDSSNVPPALPPGVVIKKEIKKEPEEQNEEDLLSKVPQEEDETSLLDLELSDNDDQDWATPAVNAAETDIASSIDGNTELTTTDSNKTTTHKIVFNVSKPAINNNNDIDSTDTNKNNDVNRNSINEEEEEFIPPPFTVDYDLKPAFRDVELVDQPLAAHGIELSGLCSVM